MHVGTERHLVVIKNSKCKILKTTDMISKILFLLRFI